MNPQVDLTQFNNVYPKEQLFQNLRRDTRYVQDIQILGTADREDVNWFVQWQLDNEAYNTRYEMDRQKAAIDMIALEVERLVKKQENILMMPQYNMIGYSGHSISNPKKKKRTIKSKSVDANRKKIASASQNKRRSALKISGKSKKYSV
jgi:hypothetical protein